MNLSLKFKIGNLIRGALSRPISYSVILNTKQWRMSRGLPVNRNAEGVLTDGPDYSYVDGRPTPLLHKQKLRMLKQQEFASQIVQLNSELDFAKERHKKLLLSKEEEKQRFISNRLKAKGNKMNKN